MPRLLIALCCLLASALHANIVINEVLAFNRNAHVNNTDYPDIIELMNTGTSTVDVTGYSLTDNPALPAKFTIPGTTTISPGGYLILFADSALASPGIHTGFGLNSDGDSLYLMNGATTVDSVTFGPQAPDVSIGRIPNGTGAFQACTLTLGTANSAASLGSITAIKINEWMAKPYLGSDWFEIYNNDARPVSIAGMWLSNNAATPKISQLPALSFIEGKGYQKFYSDKLPASGPIHLNFRLSSLGSTIVLTQSNGTTTIDRMTFGTQTTDVSQGRLPDGASTIVSMPGASSQQNPNYALTSIVINEVLANAAPPLEDAIELYNPTASAVNVGNWWLSDDLVTRKKYQIPAGTTIPAGGYLVVYENQLLSGAIPFSLLARGDEVFLSAVDANGNLTGYGALVRFGAADENVSIGRVAATGLGSSNGTAEFWRQSVPTFGQDNAATVATFRTGTGAANAGPRIGPVIVNEVMYHPPDQGSPATDYTTTEFIELYNITNAAVDISGWRLKGDSEFLLPSGTSIPARGFLLLVSFDPAVDTASLATFRSTYGLSVGSPVILGPFSQKLSNASMSVEFAKPLTVDGVSTFANVDKVEYRDIAPWPLTPDGTGHSLQRANSFVIGNTASNWTGNPPTPGTANAGAVSTLAITTATPLPGGLISSSYSTAFAATDGFAPFTFTRTSGTLPPPLTLSTGGVLSGTPNSAGTYTFTVQVKDALNNTSSKAFTVIIAATPPSISTASPLANGITGGPYTSPLAATGGTAPYSWSIESGSAPTGLTLSSAGVLSGVPLAAGTFTFTAKATDAGLLTTTKSITVTIDPSPITISTASPLPGAVKNVTYSQTLSATGGAEPYVWSLFSGSLPSPMVINSNGTITGKPTTPGVYNFTAQLTDNNGVIAAKAFTLTVYATYQIPVMNPVTLGTLTVGELLDYQLSAVNYPQTFTVTGLPSGILYSATTRKITGHAKASGVFNVQIKATNTAGSSPLITAPLVVKALPNNLVGSFTGLIARDAAANGNLGARLTLTTSSQGTFSVKITKGITLFSTTGYLATSAPQINISLGGQPLLLSLDAPSNLLTGTHGAATVDGWRSTWNTTTNPAISRAGYYSFGLDLADAGDVGQTSIPQGSGNASFTASTSGTLTVVGKTADGSVISSAGFLGPNGEIAVYTCLYANLGSIHGLLALSEDGTGGYADNTVSGSLTWSKPANTARAYKTGFGPINLEAYGKYLAPASTGNVILGLPVAGNGLLAFTQGGIGASATTPDITYSYSLANTVTVPTFASGNNPGKTALSINKNNGAVSGTFTLVDTAPALTRKVTFQGIIVRPDSGPVKARGYFLLPQKPGTGETITTSPILSGMLRITQ